jgi:hypothetical protein
LQQISEDRKNRVIDLYFNQHKTYAEIAQIEKISPRDIHTIIKEEEARRQKYKQQELSSKAYELFNQKKSTVEVAISLNLTEPRVSKMYREYCKLKRQDILNLIDKETNGKLSSFLKLYKQLIKEKGMSVDQVVNAVEIAIHKLPYMENLYVQAKDQAENMQRTVQRLENDIEARKHKISILDRTAFSIEQDCRRKHQEIQELIAQKDRLEKLIVNILNGEGYSKIKQIAKESVKAVLSDNKILISVSFAALIQTFKNDPEMVKLIHNISIANDGEQNDNNNNVIKYLEFNKDRILDLAKKNYENLVHTLTNNAIDSATCSNHALSLPQSLPTFNLGPENQSDKYRIEDSEIYHNGKGDIAD